MDVRAEKERKLEQEFQAFVSLCTESFKELFDLAKSKEEVQFAMSLNPEFRGEQGPGWSTADEARRAIDEYLNLIRSMEPTTTKTRVSLSLYAHLAEAAGFYEIPKNMLRLASGDDYNLWPFSHLVKHHAETGRTIAPNAGKFMRDLLGHARDLGLMKLEKTILQAFDFDIRNAYAHADYIIWQDGIRLRRRNGGFPIVVSYDDFTAKLNRAIAFFQILEKTALDYVRSYSTPKRVIGKLNKNDFPMPTIISYNIETGAFSITSGLNL